MASLQQTIDKIFDKYHTGITTGARLTDSDYYYIDNDNEEDFNILCNIIKYTTFKNSDKCNDAETELSRNFSDILIDYVRQGLNHEQIDELLHLVYVYNTEIQKAKKENVNISIDKLYPRYLELIFGIKLTNSAISTADNTSSNTTVQKLTFLNKGYAKRLYNNIVKLYVYDEITFDDDGNSNIFDYITIKNGNTENIEKYVFTKDDMFQADSAKDSDIKFDYTKYPVYVKSSNEYTRIYTPITDGNKYYTNRILEIPVGTDSNIISTAIIQNRLCKINDTYYKRLIVDADYISESDNEMLKYIIYKYIMQLCDTQTDTRAGYDPSAIKLVDFTCEKLSNSIILNNTSDTVKNLMLYLANVSNTINGYAELLKLLVSDNNNTFNYKVIFKQSDAPYSLLENNTEKQFAIAVNSDNITNIGYFNKDEIKKPTTDEKYYTLNEYTIAIYKTVQLDIIDDIVTDTTNMTTDVLVATYVSKIYKQNDGYIYTLECVDTSWGTNSLLCKNTDFDKNSISYNCYSVSDYKNIRNNALNIEILIEESTDQSANEITSATDTAVMYMTKNYYPTIITLQNISPSNIGALSTLYKKDNAKKYNVYVLYKELNLEYYSMINCEAFDNMVAAYIYNNNALISDAYFPLKFNTSTDTKLYGSDVILALKDASVNQYTARIANDNDIVVIQAGESNGLTDEYSETIMNSFKTIYTSVRNYFYDVLYNDSFVLDSKYRAFIFTYLIGVTLERYFTYKLDSAMDIDSYSLNECYNFLNNYGLSNITELAKNTTISKKIKILRVICGYYSDLMRYKGSKHVIDIIEEMFNNAGTKYTISLYKYLIYGKYDNTVFNVTTDTENNTIVTENNNNIVFVPVEYSASLSAENIIAAEYNAEVYTSFISSDKYWDSSVVTEDDIKELDISPIITKYLALSISVNIGEDAITNAYAISSMSYLLSKLQQDSTYGNSNTESNVVNSITFGIKSYINTDIDVNISMYQLYELYKCLLSVYVEQIGGLSTNAGFKYYGINKTATINDLYDNLNENGFIDILKDSYNTKLDKTTFNELFKTETVSIGESSSTVTDSKLIRRFLVNNIKTVNSSDESLYDSTGVSNITLLNILINNEYTNTLLNILNNNTVASAGEYNYTGLSQLESIYDILNNINLIISLNNPVLDEKYKPVIEYSDIIKAYIAYNALKNSKDNNQKYNDTIGKSINNITIDTINDNLLSPVLSFAHNYLNGKYSQLYSNTTEAFNYNVICSKFLDAVFETFFTTSEPLLYNIDEVKGSIIGSTKNAGIFSNFSKTIREKILEYVFSNAVSKNSADDYIAMHESTALSSQLEKINNIAAQFYSWYGQSENYYLYAMFESSANVNNTTTFMTDIIEMFISYTTDIYLNTTTYDYNNQNERMKYSEMYSDEISMDIDDFVYTNENIEYTIDE